MEKWKEYKLGEICKTNPSQYSLSENWETFQYLDTGSITKNIISGLDLFVGSDKLPSRARRKVKDGDILFSAVRPNLCHYGYMVKPPSNMLVSTGFVVIRVNSAIADSRFIYYYLTQNEIVTNLHNIGEQAVSTYPTIRPSDLEDLTILVPPLQIQLRIASILKSLDDKIEVNRQINDNLEQQAQALFKSWFVDFEPFKDQPFVESELGMIPQGWKVVYFKDFITPTTEKVPVGSLPEYSVTNNGIIPRDAKFNKKLSKETSKNKVLRKDNLVFGMSREILNWGIMEDEIGGVSSAYNVYKIDKGIIDPVYLRLYMKARISDFNSLIGTAAREGQSLDKGALMQKTVYVPSTKIIGEFFRLYFSIVALQKEAENESRRLTELRDTLLPRLMSGEIDINKVCI